MAYRKIYTEIEQAKVNGIGKRMRIIREMKGLTIEQVGKKLGCSKQYVSVIESTNRLSVGTLLAVCRILGTTPNVLLGYDPAIDNLMSDIETLKAKFFSKFEGTNYDTKH